MVKTGLLAFKLSSYLTNVTSIKIKTFFQPCPKETKLWRCIFMIFVNLLYLSCINRRNFSHHISSDSSPYPIYPLRLVSRAFLHRSHRNRAKMKQHSGQQCKIVAFGDLNFVFYFHHTWHFVMSIQVVAARWQFRRFVASQWRILRLHQHLLACDVAVDFISETWASGTFNSCRDVRIFIGYRNSRAISDIERTMNWKYLKPWIN